MGQGFSLFNNDNINLDAYKTENFSSTIPYAKKLYSDATTLANRLGHNTTQFSMWDEMPTNTTNYKLYQQSAEVENDNNFSDTSPFITTDVYKNLINEQLGGDFDDSTSSTSASSSSSSSSDKKKQKKHGKSKDSDDYVLFSGKDKDKKKKQKKQNKSPIEEDSESTTESNSEDNDEEEHDEEESEKESDEDLHSGMSSNVSHIISDSNDLYESSSAHTDDINSNTNITTVSAKYYRNHSAMSDSINTSDINIISVEN